MKFAPDYADRSPEAVLQWLEKTRIVYQVRRRADIARRASPTMPANACRQSRLRSSGYSARSPRDLRVIDGGAS